MEDVEEHWHSQRPRAASFSVSQSLLRSMYDTQMRTSSSSKVEAGAFPIWDCGSPLYDSHELVSLAYTIERNMMAWPHFGAPKLVTTQSYDPKDLRSTQSVPIGSSMVTHFSGFRVKSMSKKKLIPTRINNKHKKIKAMCSGFYVGLVRG